MSVSEILELCQALSPEKREAVADFARFLLSREKDLRWEAELADSKARARPEAYQTEASIDAGEPFAARRFEAPKPKESTVPGPFGTTIRPQDAARDPAGGPPGVKPFTAVISTDPAEER